MSPHGHARSELILGRLIRVVEVVSLPLPASLATSTRLTGRKSIIHGLVSVTQPPMVNPWHIGMPRITRNDGRRGDYGPRPPELLPPLLVAWDERLSRSSGTVHNAMRYRAAIEHGPAVIEAMARKAELVDEAVAGLRPGHRERLGPIMDRDFDLRRWVYDLPVGQVRMIHMARRNRHLRGQNAPRPAHRRVRGRRHLRGAGARAITTPCGTIWPPARRRRSHA